MTSKRNETQLYIEGKVGCIDINKWGSYKEKVLELIIDPTDEINLKRIMIGDAISYYQKGLISFCEAIHGIKEQRYSWSIVKLYYATFYLLRADILLSGYFLIRCGSLLYGKAKENTKLQKYHINNMRGDHQYTTAFSGKLHKEGKRIDLIQDMLIEDTIPYLWLMKQRERVNYQFKDFSDPLVDEVLVAPVDYMNANGEESLYNLYSNDEYQLYCGDEQHACIAIPYNKIKAIQKELSLKKINFEIAEPLKKHLNKFVTLDTITTEHKNL